MRTTWPLYLLALYPLGMLVLFFLGPLFYMVVVSFYKPDPMGFFEVAFVFDNYAKFFSTFYAKVSMRSIWSAGLGALITVALTFPTILFITDLGRRWQLFWVLLLLSLLCMSEVIISFAWFILLSESAGIPKLLETLGLWENARSLSPSFGAVMVGFATLGISITGLMLYPQLAQRDRALEEVARTLGTSPFGVFRRVLLPLHWPGVMIGYLTMYVYFLGVFVVPSMLGRPKDWTMSVIINDKAIGDANLPLGAALSVVMLVLACAVLVGLGLLNRWQQRRAGS